MEEVLHRKERIIFGNYSSPSTLGGGISLSGLLEDKRAALPRISSGERMLCNEYELAVSTLQQVLCFAINMSLQHLAADAMNRS